MSREKSQGWLPRIVLVILVIVLLAAAVIWYQERAAVDRREAAVAELDRIDPGWRFGQIDAARAIVPPAENGARVAGEVLRLWPAVKSLDKIAKVNSWPPNQMLSPEAWDLVESELTPLATALGVARGLAGLPAGRIPFAHGGNPTKIVLDGTQAYDHVARLMRLDVERLGKTGAMAEALVNCRAALNAGRAIGDEPIYQCQLIRSRCREHAAAALERTLGLGEVESKDLEALQEEFQDEDSHPCLWVALRGMRATGHEFLLAVEQGAIPLDTLNLRARRPTYHDLFAPSLVRQEVRAWHPFFLSLLTSRVQAAAKPLHEQEAADMAYDAELKAQTGCSPIVRGILVDPAETRVHFLAGHARLRCLVALIACERYRRANGRWPESLQQLRPAFLAEPPLDPFDGAPLRFRRLAEGVVVYSVGPDRHDDGGTIDREAPTRTGAEIGCQLWDVSARRMPPAPAPADRLGGAGR
jgi:hypothetical protein